MKQLRAGIVGCGAIASVHARVLNTLEGASLAACADILPERAQALAQEHGGTAYASLEDMLAHEALDVLHICTPHALHQPMAEAAAARGIHIFTEKPPCVTPAQWDAFAALSARVRVGVCFQNRYNPSVRHVKALLSAGDAGKILGARAFVTWTRGAEYYTQSGWRGTWALEGGSALMNQSIHTLDLLTYLLGEPTGGLDIYMANRHLQGVIETEDTVDAAIDFGGTTALFYATTNYCTDAPVLVELVCERATLRIEERPDGLNVECRWQDGRCERPTLDSATALGKGYWGTGHLVCVQDFYTSLRTGAPFQNDLQSTERTMRLVFAMYERAQGQGDFF